MPHFAAPRPRTAPARLRRLAGLAAAAGTSAALVGAALSVPATAVVDPAPGHLLMLDRASAPSPAAMAAWQSSSPYRAIAVYIPVASQFDSRLDKVQANLTAQWVADVRAGGWQVLPIYLGLQASCANYNKRISANTSTAAAQGRAMAADAATSAFKLGLPASTPIAYDLESYSRSTPGCSASTLAMQDGFTRGLHQRGRNSAVYGSVSSAITDLTTASTNPLYAKPDALWVAWWNGRADTTFTTPPASMWAGRRAHQFAGNITESYGGVSMKIDANAVQPGLFQLPPPDVSAPVLAGPTARATKAAKATLTWKMRDSSGIWRYRVQLKTGKRWSSPKALKATQRTSTRVVIKAGAKACARVRGTDRVGNDSGWQTTCISRWGKGSAFHGTGWKTKGSSATSTRGKRARGPRIAGTRIAVRTSGRVGGTIKLGSLTLATFTGAGTHWVTLPRSRSGRLMVVPAKRGKLTIKGYVAL